MIGPNIETKGIIDSFNSRIDLLITQQNKGLSTLGNERIKEIKGDYIIVLDIDKFNLSYVKCRIITRLIIGQNINIERKAQSSYL